MNLLPRWMWMTSDTVQPGTGGTTPEPDPGDMGTAFGLDASFAPEPDEAASPPEPAAPWQQRLERRPRR
ncbi:MAG: hypothetical protein KF891_17235 [Rhizobacter sp.]|nr:hypothetical protein [Rhizobacter sp.]